MTKLSEHTPDTPAQLAAAQLPTLTRGVLAQLTGGLQKINQLLAQGGRARIGEILGSDAVAIEEIYEGCRRVILEAGLPDPGELTE